MFHRGACEGSRQTSSDLSKGFGLSFLAALRRARAP
jgi:hypothetical protein